MTFRTSLTAVVAALAVAAPASASSVAYTDNHNAWLSSPDGAHKFQLTTGGSEDAAWNFPTQGPDGKTVVAHRDTFEDGSKRPVLYLYGADGKLVTANVMPVYSGATVPIYPIGMDMDWDSKTVAYGYSYCTFACNSTVRGYWLTFSDQQSLYPTDPQGQRDAYFPTFYGRRIVSSDSGGSIFVQPDVPEAPFTSSYQGWLAATNGFRFNRVKVAQAENLLAIEWTQYDGSTKVGEGITLGRHQGTIPSDVTELCDLPVAANPSSASFSPDGKQVAWSDAEGVKVANVPNLAECSLTQPVTVLSATGRNPSFGGADVAAIVNPPEPGTGDGGGTATPGGGTTTPGGETPTTPVGGGAVEPPRPVTVKLAGKAKAALLAKGRLAVSADVPAAGRVTVTASVPSSKLRARSSLARAAAKGIGTVVARGSANAKAGGRLKVRLKPTKAARRAAKKLRGATLTLTVTQGQASGSAKVKLR